MDLGVGAPGGLSGPGGPGGPKKQRLLFFRQGSFSHINDRVAGWLREQFPTLELVEIDVLQDVVKSSGLAVGAGAAAALMTYAGRIARGERDFRDLFYRTPYLFRAIRRIIAKKYAGLAREALFSIQTQSLYDAGIDGLPHFLYTDHTHLANLRHPRPSPLAAPSWIALEKSIYHRVRKNLVMSRFVEQSLIEDYGCDPAGIANIGAAPNLPPPSSPPDNAGYSNRTILFVGVDWERKGGPVIAEAFRKVLEKLPDARLIIAGSSPSLDLPNLEIAGRVPLAEISRLLLRSSVLALPTWREPQGVNAIEALMHSIPVVATKVGALPEMVLDGKTGRIIPPGDAPALAAALIDLLSDPALCRQYGETGREDATARYSSAAVSKKMGDAIRFQLEL